jgi:hypothetical protein
MSKLRAPYRIPYTNTSVWLSSDLISAMKDIVAYDKNLSVVFNAASNKYEIWEYGKDGKDHLIRSYTQNELISTALEGLKRDNLSRLGYRVVVAELDKQDAAVEEQNKKGLDELGEAIADRLEFDIRKKIKKGEINV